MGLPLTLACRRGERDRGRLVAVELHGRLRRRDVPARSGCGLFCTLGRARDRGRAMWWCAAEPCQYPSDGSCDVPQYCATGDYIDCGTVGPVVSGTLPDAIGSLACRSKITRLCARPPTRRSRRCVRPPTRFKRPARYFASNARRSQGHHRLPRPSRQRAADDLRADRAHDAVRPLRAAGLAADAGPASQRERSGRAWAVHLRRGLTPRCARSGT